MTVTATSGSTWDTAGYLVTLAGSVLGSGEVALVDSTGIPGGLTFNPGAGSQIITVGLSGSGTLTKAGSGKTTLDGPGGFVGSMNHSAGTLLIDGNFSSLSVAVADGAVFGGEGTIASLVLGTSTGGGLAVDPTTSGALTILGNVTLTGTTRLTFSFGPEPIGSPITLFSYGGTLTGLSNLLPGMANYRSPTVSNVAAVVSVTLGNKSLVWNGASGGQWQVAGGVNRWNAGETDAFYWGDAVRFDDGGAATTVAVTGEVRPAAIVVDNSSKNYTFASSAGNVIAGATSIIKSGTASLTLTGPNTYTGTTTVRQGRVTGTNNSAFGASTIVLGDAGTGSGVLELFLDPMTAGANLTAANAITVNSVAADVTAVIGSLGSSANQVTRAANFTGALTLLDDVIFRSGAHDATLFSGAITGASGLTISVENGLLAPGNATSTHFGRGQAGNRVTLTGSANNFLGNWVIKSGSASNLTILQVNNGDRINDNSNVHVEEFAVFRLNSAETINALTGNGRVRAVSARVLTVGGGDGSGTFNGILENDAFDVGTLAFTKVGSGTQTLTGASSYTGGTNVNAGVLLVNNSTGSATGAGQVTVAAGATLGGNGAIAASNAGANITINGTLKVGNAGDNLLSDRMLVIGAAAGAVVFNGALELDIFGQAQPGMATDHGQSYADVLKLSATTSVVLGGELRITAATLDSTSWDLGDAWQLFDWSSLSPGSVSGSFTSFVLPTLASSDLKWDTSHLGQTGYIMIAAVPEPGRMGLWCVVGMAMCLRRRRRKGVRNL